MTTRKQFDVMIAHLLEQSKHYTMAAKPQGEDSSFICNITTSMVLAGIAGALIAARKEAPPEPRFYRNEEENDG